MDNVQREILRSLRWLIAKDDFGGDLYREMQIKRLNEIDKILKEDKN